MSMYNDIAWREKGNREVCVANSFMVADYARKFAQGHWSFLGLGSEKKRYGTDVSNQMENGTMSLMYYDD